VEDLVELRRAAPVDVSEAPEGLRVTFADGRPPGTGVDDPDGVLVLADDVEAEEVVRPEGDRVRLALPLMAGTVSLRGVAEPLADRVDVNDLLGIRLGVPSSELARERLDPCRLGGLLPVRLAGRLLLRLPGRLPPGVRLDLWPPGVDTFLGVRE